MVYSRIAPNEMAPIRRIREYIILHYIRQYFEAHAYNREPLNLPLSRNAPLSLDVEAVKLFSVPEIANDCLGSVAAIADCPENAGFSCERPE